MNRAAGSIGLGVTGDFGRPVEHVPCPKVLATAPRASLLFDALALCLALLQAVAALGQDFDYRGGAEAVGPIYPLPGESGISVDNPASWITVSGSGPGTIYTITVAANEMPDAVTGSRAAVVIIGNASFQITQQGVDNTYHVSTNRFNIPAIVDQHLYYGVGYPVHMLWVAVTSAVQNSPVPLQITSGADWLSLYNDYYWGPNPGDFGFYTGAPEGLGIMITSQNVIPDGITQDRTGTVLVAGRPITVTQQGFDNTYYLATPNSFTYPATSSGNLGWVVMIVPYVQNGLPFQVTSGADWLSTSMGSGGDLPLNAPYFQIHIESPNVSTNGVTQDRIGTIQIAGQNVTVLQLGTAPPPVQSGGPSIGNANSYLPQANGMAGEPIDTENGAHIITRSLLKLRGAQDLEFVIDYHSICLFDDIVGTGWSHNFEASCSPIANGTVRVNWNAKISYIFVPQAPGTNVLRCPDLPVVYDSLIANGDGTFTLKEPSQRHFEFDASGRLQQIVNAHGQAIHLVYPSASSYPTQIVEAVSGFSLALAYNPTNQLLSQVSDAAGRSVAFLYDSLNHLTALTKSDAKTSQTITFTYDSAGRVLSETDPEGVRVFEDVYDSYGRVVSQSDAVHGNNPYLFSYDESQTDRLITTVMNRSGATNVYVHDRNYLLVSVTDGLGYTTSYGYNANGDEVAVTNALGQVQTFAYDSAGNRISATDAAGFTTTYQYDSSNNLTNLVNAVSNTASFIYDANNNLFASLDFMTNLVTRAYDANAQLAQVVSARGGTNTFVRSGGLLTSRTDAVGNTTQMAYDPAGRLVTVTNGAGFVTTNAYDINDNLIAVTDGMGSTWRYTYDSAGRRLSSTDPLGNSTDFAYNGNGNLIATTNALGGVTRHAYDGEDRLVSVTDANGHKKSMAYDLDGRLLTVADALNHTNLFQYDDVGNLIATVDALGITNQVTTYDARNQPVSAQDALGNLKHLSYDALQRLILTVDALGRTNSLAYDPLSRITSSTDPLSLVTRQQFDGDGNRTAVINPKSAESTFQYDLARRLTAGLTPTGKQTSYAFDGRNLVTNLTQPSGAQVLLAYDAAGRLTNFQDSVGTIVYGYDAKGRQVSAKENSLTITRQYDALDRLTNYTDAAGNVIQYAYDNVGNLTNLTYPDGKQVGYAYDAANRMVAVTDWEGRVTTYAYDADNRITLITHPNGTRTARSYDLAGRLIHQADVTANSNSIYQVDYGYDAAGQIIGETNQPQTTAFLPAAVAMAYDADDALTNYCGQAVTNDADGNMVYGPLTNGAFAAYTYDARNRLTNAGGVGYGYDPIGNRLALTNNGSVTTFVIKPNARLSQLLMRLQNGVTNYYVYGAAQLVYEVTSTAGTNTMLTYHYDYRGSTVAVTDPAGNVFDQVSYSPYGCIVSRTGTTDTPFLFNGSFGVQTDPNGLLYMRARFYNATICRFLTPDPIGLNGGPNRYAYVAGKPISLNDPSGLCADDLLANFDQRIRDTFSQAIAGLGQGTSPSPESPFDSTFSPMGGSPEHLLQGMQTLNNGRPLEDGWYIVGNAIGSSDPWIWYPLCLAAVDTDHSNLVQVQRGSVARIEGFYPTESASPFSASASASGIFPGNNEQIVYVEPVHATDEAMNSAIQSARATRYASGASYWVLVGGNCHTFVNDVVNVAHFHDFLNTIYR